MLKAYDRDTRPKEATHGCCLHPGVPDHGTVDRDYDFIAEKIGTGPFDGLIVHSAGFDDEAGVFRIIDIWESKEQAEQFIEEHLQPLIDEGPNAFPNPDAFGPPLRDGFYELHDVIQQASTVAPR